MADIKALLQQHLSLTPLQSVSLPGYSAPAQMQDHSPLASDGAAAEMVDVARDILADPQALALFSDRVYEYLQRDMKLQQERSGRSIRRLR